MHFLTITCIICLQHGTSFKTPIYRSYTCVHIVNPHPNGFERDLLLPPVLRAWSDCTDV